MAVSETGYKSVEVESVLAMQKAVQVQVVASIPASSLIVERLEHLRQLGCLKELLGQFWASLLTDILRVDRRGDFVYPNYTKGSIFSEIERIGPDEVDLNALELLVLPGQQDRRAMRGYDLRICLTDVRKVIGRCLSVFDGQAMLQRQDLIPAGWNGKEIGLWKSLVGMIVPGPQSSRIFQSVPVLSQRRSGLKWEMVWINLDSWFDRDHLIPLFPEAKV